MKQELKNYQYLIHSILATVEKVSTERNLDSLEIVGALEAAKFVVIDTFRNEDNELASMTFKEMN